MRKKLINKSQAYIYVKQNKVSRSQLKNNIGGRWFD